MDVDDSELECSVCFSRSMAVINGALICTVCGFQARAFTEEQEEDADMAGSQPVRRSQRALQGAVGLKGRVEEVPTDAEVVAAYCSCVQESLKVLSTWFQEELNLDRVFESVCRRLWQAALTASGVLEPDFLVGIKSQGQDEEIEDEDAPSDLRQLRTRLHRALHPAVMLAILLLANTLLRTVVTPMDLVSLALSAKLPYFATLAENCAAVDPNDRMRLLYFFQRTSIRGAQEITMDAAALASKLQLRLPAINAEAILQRYCLDLALPLEACAGAQAVLEVYHAAGLRLAISTAKQHAPYAQLMAMLVCAVRAEYQEGDGRSRLPPGFDWAVWARRVLGRASSRQPPGLQSDGHVFGDIDAAQAALRAGLGKLVQQEEHVRDVQESLRQFWEAMGTAAPAPDIAQPQAAAEGQGPEERVQTEYAFLVIAAASVIWTDPALLHQLVHRLGQEVAKIERAANKL